MRNNSQNFLSPKESIFLLQLARQTLENYFTKQQIKLNNLPQGLFSQHGAFVTLRKQGELRGCIGLVESDQLLYQTVCQMALESALTDPRFWPLKKEELKDVKIEISVLTKPQKINSAEEIKLGVDGVIVKRGFCRGVFLPQVARETGWSLAEFMDHLCADKAGLSADAWQAEDCEIYTFQVQIFEEK